MGCIEHWVSVLYALKAFQHAEKAIRESNCKKSRLKCLQLFPDFVTFWRLKNIISDFQQHRIIKG